VARALPLTRAHVRAFCVFLAATAVALCWAAPSYGQENVTVIPPGGSADLPIGESNVLSPGSPDCTSHPGTYVTVVPSDALTVETPLDGFTFTPGTTMRVRVSPTVSPGVIIGISWATAGGNCYSANGIVYVEVGQPQSGGGGGGGGSGGGSGGSDNVEPPCKPLGGSTLDLAIPTVARLVQADCDPPAPVDDCVAKAKYAHDVADNLHDITAGLAGIAMLLSLGFTQDDLAALTQLLAGGFKEFLPKDILAHVQHHAHESPVWDTPTGTQAQKNASAIQQVEEVLKAPDRQVVVTAPDRGNNKGKIVVEISTPPKNGKPGRLVKFIKTKAGFLFDNLGDKVANKVVPRMIGNAARPLLLAPASVALLAAGVTAAAELSARMMAAIYDLCVKNRKRRASGSADTDASAIKVPKVKIPEAPRFNVSHTGDAGSARQLTTLSRNLVAQSAYEQALTRMVKVARTGPPAKAAAYGKAARNTAKRLAKLITTGGKLRERIADDLGLGVTTLQPQRISQAQANRLVGLTRPLLSPMKAPASVANKLRASVKARAAAGGTVDLNALFTNPALSETDRATAAALTALAKSL
jgi:hypothetical protein